MLIQIQYRQLTRFVSSSRGHCHTVQSFLVDILIPRVSRQLIVQGINWGKKLPRDCHASGPAVQQFNNLSKFQVKSQDEKRFINFVKNVLLCSALLSRSRESRETKSTANTKKSESLLRTGHPSSTAIRPITYHQPSLY